jgi:hypothetical protein
MLLQYRFVVEQIKLRRRADHMQEDDVFRSGSVMSKRFSRGIAGRQLPCE